MEQQKHCPKPHRQDVYKRQTQNLMDNDDPLGMRKLYIRKECCKLTGITYLP